MPKRKTQKRKKSVNILKILLILAILTIGVVCLVEFTDFDFAKLFHPENSLTPVPEPPEASTETSTDVTPTDPEPVEEEIEKPTQYDGQDPNASNTLTGNITYADILNHKVTIRANINQFLSSGTCELIMKNGELSYSEQANIVESASTATCQGFDIPVNNFQSGHWSISIYIKSKNKTGLIEGGIDL